jgi:REP element-mobilizing transposase RayT
MIHAHSDVLLLVHVVFSTINRQAILDCSMDEWLHSIMRSLTYRGGGELLGVGSFDDHVHVLLRYESTATLCDLVKQIKGASSRAWNQRGARRRLEWQRGYWARSVERESLGRLQQYLRDQRLHHALGTVDRNLEQHGDAGTSEQPDEYRGEMQEGEVVAR